LSKKTQHPRDREQTLAHFSREIVLAAEASENRLERLGVENTRRFGVADLAGNGLAIRADALEDIGHTVDNPVDDAEDDGRGPCGDHGSALTASLERPEGLGVYKADRHQLVVRQHEGDHISCRMVGLGVREHERGHEGRASLAIEGGSTFMTALVLANSETERGHEGRAPLAIEAARDLDLLH